MDPLFFCSPFHYLGKTNIKRKKENWKPIFIVLNMLRFSFFLVQFAALLSANYIIKCELNFIFSGPLFFFFSINLIDDVAKLQLQSISFFSF